MWPCASVLMPPTWPMIQLFGSGFGQDASTAKVGTSPAIAAPVSAGRPISAAAAMQAEMARFFAADIARARFIGMRVASLDFIGGFFPLGVQLIAGKGRSQRFDAVIARSEATKQSILVLRPHGLLRFARND